MAKQIKLSYEGKDYVLEYSRKGAEFIEKQGFEIGNIQGKMATNLPLLFRGAFYMHHRSLNEDKIMSIYEGTKVKGKLTTILIEMISEVYNSMFDANENEEDEKNANWEIV